MEDIIRYIIDPGLFPPEIVKTIDYIRYFFISISFILLGLVIYFSISSRRLEEMYLKDILEFTKAAPYKEIKLPKDWGSLRKRAKDEKPSERKLAIIETDDMMCNILNEMGYEGDTLDESLQEVTTDIVSNKDDLLRVHKIRRDLIYDPNYELSQDEAKEIMDVFEKSLSDLQFL